MVLRTSIGGKRVRVKLANAFNGTPVEIGAAHIAIRDADAGIVAGSDRALTFSGRPSVKMAPGMVVVSDPVDLDVRAADRPRRQPLLPGRYRHADDARDGTAADLRLG